MNADEYLRSDAYIQQTIMDELLGMVKTHCQVIELETIRRNPAFHRYSDDQILRAIYELVDRDLFDLRQHNPALERLRNGYIIRRR